ncbi:MAG: phospholipase B family protein [Bryobacteraceae bacterium]|nr:phospholipase B family protein [Bryobacteraceae bacterium]MCX7602500.1 phospholipase B family protein [Bryobacteraceae bacterium]
MTRREWARFAAGAAAAFPFASCRSGADQRLAGARRSPMVNGWIPVRLSGSPEQIGYQHGYLLAREIEDALAVTRLNLKHDTGRDWPFFREAAERILWPKVPSEYQREIRGMSEGLGQAGVKADVYDLTVLNASIELGYYTAWLDGQARSGAQDRCSAFVATGSWTRGREPVIAHNNWSGYLEGARWNIIFDIRPERGHRILMDGFPGFIHSGDDFGINSAGLAITETTITAFRGFDPEGVPEFARARLAMQYASSIDEFAAFMIRGNNGGYANAWLVADTRRNEIGRLELGLKNVVLEKTSDGCFPGANFPVNPKLAAEETTFPVNDPSVSANARRLRWEQLLAEHKGRIGLEEAKRFVSDHYDTFEKKPDSPNERTLCGHVDLSPRGMKPWQDEFGPAGAVQAKAADARMIRNMELEAAMGHPCGIGFRAEEHLKKYPQFGWMRPLLRDLPSHPWTRFRAE